MGAPRFDRTGAMYVVPTPGIPSGAPLPVSIADTVDVSVVSAVPVIPLGLIEGLQISRGLVSGITFVNKFGYNGGLPNGTYEDVWDGSTNYTYLSAEATMEVVSSGVDNSGGTGARKIVIVGQGDDGLEATEEVTLSGGTAVVVKKFKRIYRAYVTDVGAGGVNANLINIRVAPGGVSQAQIQAGAGQTLMAIYTVPSDKTAYVKTWGVDAGSASAAVTMVADLYFRLPGKSWRLQDRAIVRSTGSSVAQNSYICPIVIPAGSDIRVAVMSNVVNATAAARFSLILEAN